MASDSAKYKGSLPIKKILVPVDYSECSEFACRYAAKIACKLGGQIRFLHAYYTPSFDLIELSGTVQIQSQLKEEVTVKVRKVGSIRFLLELTRRLLKSRLGVYSMALLF